MTAKGQLAAALVGQAQGSASISSPPTKSQRAKTRMKSARPVVDFSGIVAALDGLDVCLREPASSQEQITHVQELFRKIMDAEAFVLYSSVDVVDCFGMSMGQLRPRFRRVRLNIVGSDFWSRHGGINDFKVDQLWGSLDEGSNVSCFSPGFVTHLFRTAEDGLHSSELCSGTFPPRLICLCEALRRSPHPKAGAVALRIDVKLLSRYDLSEDSACELSRNACHIIRTNDSWLFCTATWRELCSKGKDCHYCRVSDQRKPPRGLSRFRCFHMQHKTLFDELQKRARQEIRFCVHLVVGRHLPAELAELVVDKIILMEEPPVKSGHRNRKSNISQARDPAWRPPPEI